MQKYVLNNSKIGYAKLKSEEKWLKSYSGEHKNLDKSMIIKNFKIPIKHTGSYKNQNTNILNSPQKIYITLFNSHPINREWWFAENRATTRPQNLPQTIDPAGKKTGPKRTLLSFRCRCTERLTGYVSTSTNVFFHGGVAMVEKMARVQDKKRLREIIWEPVQPEKK